LIHSGANISVFREEIAECLEIVIEEGEETLLQGLGGRIVGYIHEVKVRVDNEEFFCNVVFSKELTVGLNILGREGFFEYFQVIFNESAKEVGFEMKRTFFMRRFVGTWILTGLI